ncbi:acyl-CoA dehydrogenase family protein [Gammaproteobacteria bacterium]|jgi:acyl-CoA dehydrogenase|nr:acyl-CoA dehydrogenase family protein [Gammaproteobacteria bacterium]MDA8982368.1 acyl-CoA dehydrogenase family protein [Gammaproteobacteria bacterium]MDA9997878.1 acyl-CoA dehydrogenase family protein [Gammaproteobacteria bacterium]MDC1123623.1 acyl-CoA dehydrogenase family protein [Gammaproteobacteria bacterium]MDC3247558.1 acyl-CoA dehydrogenase family protein [Gammaproteobacteria bacterium]
MIELRPQAVDLIKRVRDFIDEEIAHNENLYHEQSKDANGKWLVPPIMEEMKAKAKTAGLWNLFLPESENGAGLTNYEYAHLAEAMGAYGISSEVFNCSAPDTGNMEVLERYGNDEHKEKYLKPLLNGEIRSAFGMTEPGVASSDATNIASSAVLDGDEYVINGEKWWTSGAGDPRCEIIIFMCVTNPDNHRHQRQSQILVPMNAEGIEIKKMMHVFGYDDAPHGHAHIKFTNVRVPKENLLLGEGRGFEIAQGRLGPGRIHHCMRAIGLAERALKMMCEKGMERVAFGKPIIQLGGNMDIIANSRIEIDQARLLTLRAAHMMDTVGNKVAASEIAQIKVVAPNVCCDVIDRAIQIHGGAGVSQVYPLANMYAHMRTLRLADGPDEVHRRAVARQELGKYKLNEQGKVESSYVSRS